jgi:hypothetical protein
MVGTIRPSLYEAEIIQKFIMLKEQDLLLYSYLNIVR